MKVRKEIAESRLQTSGKEGDERFLRMQKKIEEHNSELKKKERLGFYRAIRVFFFFFYQKELFSANTKKLWIHCNKKSKV